MCPNVPPSQNTGCCSEQYCVISTLFPKYKTSCIVNDHILVPEDKALFLGITDVPLFMGRYTGETLILGAPAVDVKQSQHASVWDQNNAV